MILRILSFVIALLIVLAVVPSVFEEPTVPDQPSNTTKPHQIISTPATPSPNQSVMLTTTLNGTTGYWTIENRSYGQSKSMSYQFTAGKHTVTFQTANTTLQTNITSTYGACEPYRLTGPSARKVDVVFIARNYKNKTDWQSHLEYYLDFDQDNRGLFDVYPMNVTTNRFNIWTRNASNAIGTYNDPRDDRGLIKDARRDWFSQCDFADYEVIMSYDAFNHSAFAYSDSNEIYIPDISSKMEQEDGAVALIHEWGHGFGGLKDEYDSEDGRDAHGKPNCAANRSQAEQWWGDLAATNPHVDYYRGCAYTDTNWRPHGRSIMGNGGLWHYGPVNDRKLWSVLSQYE